MSTNLCSELLQYLPEVLPDLAPCILLVGDTHWRRVLVGLSLLGNNYFITCPSLIIAETNQSIVEQSIIIIPWGNKRLSLSRPLHHCHNGEHIWVPVCV